MEDLRSLMACLDDISSKIPDGIYLEMADKMKRVHDHMNGNKAFHEDTFYYSDTESDDDSDSDFRIDNDVPQSAHDELTEIMECLRKVQSELRVVRKSLDTLKPIQRITKKVREAAMRHFTSRMSIIDIDIFKEFDWEEATFENYVRLTNWENTSPAERKGLTSKKFEKKIYEDYKMFENRRIDARTRELNELRRKLESEIDELGAREDNLRLTFGLLV